MFSLFNHQTLLRPKVHAACCLLARACRSCCTVSCRATAWLRLALLAHDCFSCSFLAILFPHCINARHDVLRATGRLSCWCFMHCSSLASFPRARFARHQTFAFSFMRCTFLSSLLANFQPLPGSCFLYACCFGLSLFVTQLIVLHVLLRLVLLRHAGIDHALHSPCRSFRHCTHSQSSCCHSFRRSYGVGIAIRWHRLVPLFLQSVQCSVRVAVTTEQSHSCCVVIDVSLVLRALDVDSCPSPILGACSWWCVVQLVLGLRLYCRSTHSFPLSFSVVYFSFLSSSRTGQIATLVTSWSGAGWTFPLLYSRSLSV